MLRVKRRYGSKIVEMGTWRSPEVDPADGWSVVMGISGGSKLKGRRAGTGESSGGYNSDYAACRRAFIDRSESRIQ